MVEVPDRAMAAHVIAEALEWGDHVDVPTTYMLGEYGQHETELKWSLNDLNPEKCDIDMKDDSTVVVSQEITAEYSIQTSRRSRHHPAEYETKTVPLWIGIELDLSEWIEPKVFGELH